MENSLGWKTATFNIQPHQLRKAKFRTPDETAYKFTPGPMKIRDIPLDCCSKCGTKLLKIDKSKVLCKRCQKREGPNGAFHQRVYEDPLDEAKIYGIESETSLSDINIINKELRPSTISDIVQLEREKEECNHFWDDVKQGCIHCGEPMRYILREEQEMI